MKTGFFYIILLFFVLTVNTNLKSQNIDSLFLKLNTATNSEKIDLYIQISKYYVNSNPNLSILYSNKGITLSDKINKTDKKTHLYVILANSYISLKNYDTAIIFLDSASFFIRKTKDIKQTAYINYLFGKIYYETENYEKAEEFFYISENLYSEIQDTLSMIASFERLGMINYMKSNQPKAIEFFMTGLKLAEQINFIEAQASAKNNLAMAYATDGDNENALKYYSEALKIYQNLENYKGLATVYNNIGNIYIGLHSYDSALVYFQKSLNLTITNDDEIMIAICKTNIAEVYIALSNTKEALKYLEESKITFEKYQIPTYLTATYHLYGKLYLLSENYDYARNNFEKSLNYAHKSNYKILIKDNFFQLSELYKNTNDYQNAYFYFIKYNDLKDSLFNIENSLKINQLKINYETEKKDKELKLNELEIKRQKKLLLFFQIALMIFFILIVIVVIFYRKLNKSYKKIVEINVQMIDTKQNDISANLFKKSNEDNELYDNTDENYINKIHTLKPENIEILREGVEKLINEKIYLDKDISLDKMSKILSTNKLYLSKFINNEYHKNFNTFINTYRIKEAQKFIISPAYENYTLDAIADLAGFKSRSSFYSIFKSVTGVTPSFFKKEMATNR